MVRWLRLAGVLVLMVTAYFVVPVRADPTLDGLVRGAGAVALLVAAALLSVQQVRRNVSGADDARVDGLVLAIVVSVVAFSFVGYSLEVHNPGEFADLETRLDALYFTLTTLLTVGYGDVHADGQGARALVVVQMVFNVVVVAATASVLTTRVRAAVQRRGRERDPGDDDIR